MSTSAPARDLVAIGMNYPSWQDAVEAAIATNALTVTGEVRGGQLVQFADPSGAQINILAVEPFATFAGFEAVALSFAHVSMVNDVVALVEIVDYNGSPVSSVCANLAQGPLLVDEQTQTWQQVGLVVLADSADIYPDTTAYEAATGLTAGWVDSPGATVVSQGSAEIPDAKVTFSARVLEAESRTNALTGQQFVHATVDGSFAFDVCLPAGYAVPAKNAVITGSGVLAGAIQSQSGCGTGGGCGSGGCGCGGH